MLRAPQIHLKNRELENTKLSAELQMLKSVDVNKENTIAQFKEEVGRLQACLIEKETQYREVLAKVSPLVWKIPIDFTINPLTVCLPLSAILSVTVLTKNCLNFF